MISAINGLRVVRFEIDSNGNPIPTTVVRVTAPLDSSVEQGPVTVGIPYQDLPQLLDRHGYSLDVSSTTLTHLIALFPCHSLINDKDMGRVLVYYCTQFVFYACTQYVPSSKYLE